MLHRKDKKRLSIGLIPNGSLNLYATTMKCKSIDTAIDYLVKGDLVRIDVIKAIIDH